MAYYEYRYWIDGRKLSIVQRAIDTVFSDSSVVTSDFFVTPTEDVTDGILLQYAYTVTQPTAESDTIDVSNTLALALVDYVRHRVLEDKGDTKGAEGYYAKFLRRVAENEHRKVGGLRKAIPGGVSALR